MLEILCTLPLQRIKVKVVFICQVRRLKSTPIKSEGVGACAVRVYFWQHYCQYDYQNSRGARHHVSGSHHQRLQCGEAVARLCYSLQSIFTWFCLFGPEGTEQTLFFSV